MDTSNINLRSKNLLLKSILLDYKDDIFREFTDEITVYMFPKSPEKIDDTVDFINTAMEKNSKGIDFQVVIIDKKTEEFLGCGGIHHINRKNPEFGIWIKKSAHGNAYGREAVAVLKKWADENLDYEYLLYPADKENIASRKIPESLGGMITREYKKLNQRGKKLNLVEYRIFKKE